MSLNPRAVLNRPDAASRGNLPENPKFHEKSKGACLRRRVPSSIWTQRRSSTPRATPRGWSGARPSSRGAPATRRTSPRSPSAAGCSVPSRRSASPHLVRGFQRYGLIGGAVVASALRHGDRAVMIDERGELTYKELDERSNALANAWRKGGLEAGEGVAILARNHRGFLEAVFAAAKCGARIVLLNTSFAGPQIREVATREGTDLLVYDEEYAETLEGIDDPQRGRYRAWADEAGDDTLDALIDGGDTARATQARFVAADHDLDQRHHRDAQGCSALGAALAVADRRPAQQGAVPLPRGHRAVRADVPRARVHAGDRRRRARVDARGAPAVRPRGDARKPRGAIARPRWSSSR